MSQPTLPNLVEPEDFSNDSNESVRGYPADIKSNKTVFDSESSRAGRSDLESYITESSGALYENWIRIQNLDGRIGFSEVEVQVTQELYARMVENRISHEALIATITRSEIGQLLIEIPDYSKFGSILEKDFYKSIEASLGEKKSTTLHDALSDLISSSNAFFGTSEQQILVNLPNSKDVPLVKIVHTIRNTFFALDRKTVVSTFPIQDWGDYGHWKTLIQDHAMISKEGIQ